jgi:hypothetical protein
MNEEDTLEGTWSVQQELMKLIDKIGLMLGTLVAIGGGAFLIYVTVKP